MRRWSAHLAVLSSAVVTCVVVGAACLESVGGCRNSSDCPPGFLCTAATCCPIRRADAGLSPELFTPSCSCPEILEEEPPLPDAGFDAGPDAGEIPHRDLPWRPLRPNMMLAVDKSGSMVEPADRSCTDAVPTCCTTTGKPGGPYSAASPNGCKWKDVLRVLADDAQGLLKRYEARLRFGLAQFPDGAACNNGHVYTACDEGTSPTVAKTLQSTAPVGGTSTGGTLDKLVGEPSLNDPLHTPYVMLLTDGVPNCNAANRAKCERCIADPNQCRGPIAPDGSSAFCNPSFSCNGVFSGSGCLDGEGMVAAITRLKQKGVLTIVVGFGNETATPEANIVLNAAAEAGGLPRSVPPRYYQANTAAELASFLESVARAVPQCKFEILEAVARDDLRVLLDKAIVMEDTQDGYTFDDKLRLVTFVGTTCRILSDGTEHEIRFQTAKQ